MQLPLAFSCKYSLNMFLFLCINARSSIKNGDNVENSVIVLQLLEHFLKNCISFHLIFVTSLIRQAVKVLFNM